MKVEAALGHWSSPWALHHAGTRRCISLPFSISFIANIARKRPELNCNRSISKKGLRSVPDHRFDIISAIFFFGACIDSSIGKPAWLVRNMTLFGISNLVIGRVLKIAIIHQVKSDVAM